MSVQRATVSTIDTSLDQLDTVLQRHLRFGNRCENFFGFFTKNPITLAAQQKSDQSVFSYMFNGISQGSLKQWEQEYQNIATQVNGLDPQEKEVLNKRLNELEETIQLCKKTNSVFTSGIISLIKNEPKKLFLDDGLFFLPPLTTMNGEIGECHCSKIMEREGRNSFSTQLVAKVLQHFPKDKPISIVSIGAGACFHELEIHTLLSEKGINIHHWTLIDPVAFNPKTVANFETMVKWVSPDTNISSVQSTAVEYFNNLNATANPPDVFLFIDLENHVTSKDIDTFRLQMKHRCLFAELTKNVADQKDAAKFTMSG